MESLHQHARDYTSPLHVTVLQPHIIKALRVSPVPPEYLPFSCLTFHFPALPPALPIPHKWDVTALQERSLLRPQHPVIVGWSPSSGQ